MTVAPIVKTLRKLDMNAIASSGTAVDRWMALIDELITKVNLHSVALGSATGPFHFAGTISLAADFPTTVLVEAGDVYAILADVTDNDGTKTNTGDSFMGGSEIAWDGAAWVDLGLETTVSYVGTTPATPTAGEFILAVDTVTIAGTAVVDLPAVSATRVGKTIAIYDASGAATVAAPINIVPNGLDAIDGANVAIAITTAFSGYTMTCVQTGAASYGWVTGATGADALRAREDNTYSTHAVVALETLANQVDANLNGIAGKFFHPRRIIVKLTAIAATPNGDAAITVGTTHAGTEILPATILTGLVAVNDQYVIDLAGYFPGIASDATIHVTVTTADTGGGATATATAKLEGYID